MDPRKRRLKAEKQILKAAFGTGSPVALSDIALEFPTSYQLLFRLPGVRLEPGSNQPIMVDQHEIWVSLPEDYPIDAPICTAGSRIFHPNVGPEAGEAIDLLDPWTPNLCVADVVVALANMIQYRRYDLDNSTNQVAATWVAAHESIFPLSHVDLATAHPRPSAYLPSADESWERGGDDASGEDVTGADIHVDGEVGGEVDGKDPQDDPEAATSTTNAAGKRRRSRARGMELPPDETWWLASDGKYYPPELHPDRRSKS